MQTSRTILLMVSLLFAVPVAAQDTGAGKVEPLPRELEIELALSALPPHLKNSATVYSLNLAKGFEVARKGTNGFHAFVARTAPDSMRGTWAFTHYRDDILYPIAFDAAGAKAHMRVYFDIAEMQAKGTPPQEAKRIVQERYKTGVYKAPERAGISYMLALILRNYVDPDKDDSVETSNEPHVMHYAPNISNADISGTEPPYPFVILHGPHGYVIQHFGKEQAAAITAEYGVMLKKLCQLKQSWCLPAPRTR